MNLRRAALQLAMGFFVLFALCACAPDYSYTSGFGSTSKIRQYKHAGDLWTELGKNFYLPNESDQNPAVAWQIQWFLHNPVYLQRMAKSAAPYLYYIYQQVKKRHLPAELTLLPMVESAYDPFATNYKSGAAGLWQMMPGTASGFGLRVNWWYDGRRDVIASTNAALNYFVFLGNFFNNDWLLAIAAYDSGEGTVQRSMERNAKLGRPTKFWFLSLPYETETYVPKLLALATIIKHPNRYPVNLPTLKNAPYLAQVNVGSQIDLARAAKMAGISLTQLTDLNPGFNRWATDPRGSHKLVLPIKNAAHFKHALKKLPIAARVSWHRIIIKRGDVLTKIAATYHTRVNLIRQINHLRNNNLRIGQVLLIPSKTSKTRRLILNSEKLFSNHKIPALHLTRHVVKKHETLLGIAKRYHVTPRQIRFWNGMHNNRLQPGVSLTLWPPHKKNRPFYQHRTIYAHYRVKPGDSLWTIAHKYHVSLKLISQHNHLKHNLIKPHQVLLIPIAHHHANTPRHIIHKTKRFVHRKKHTAKQHKQPHKWSRYHVKKGDFLYAIAHAHHITLKQLLERNHLKSKHITLKIGQTLFV
jgi:membrane-bound lytic murein transglycosylase D